MFYSKVFLITVLRRHSMNSSTIDFITNLLSDTLHLDFHYFIAPYPDLVSFDKHLRKSLNDSTLLYKKIQ